MLKIRGFSSATWFIISSRLGNAQYNGSVFAFTARKSTKNRLLPSLLVVRNTGEFHSDVLSLIIPVFRRSLHNDLSFCSFVGSYQNRLQIAGFVSFNGMVWRGTRASGTRVTFSAIISRARYSTVVNFSYCVGLSPSVPTLTPRRWSSASRSRWSGSTGLDRSVSCPSTLCAPPLEIALVVCVCGVICTFIQSVMSTRFPLTALTSKGARYANAWPVVQVIDLKVGFMTWHRGQRRTTHKNTGYA